MGTWPRLNSTSLSLPDQQQESKSGILEAAYMDVSGELTVLDYVEGEELERLENRLGKAKPKRKPRSKPKPEP